MKRASSGLSLVLVAALFAAASGSCAADSEDPRGSPCVAFAKAAPLQLMVEPVPELAVTSSFVRVSAGAGRLYALDRDGRIGRAGADAGAFVAVGGIDFAVTKDKQGLVQAFVARLPVRAGPPSTTDFELVRLTSRDDGLTFDPNTEKVLLTEHGAAATDGTASLAFAADDLLYVAIGEGPAAPSEASLLGKILRIDVSGDVVVPEVWAAPVHQPRGLDVDRETGDLWLTDYSSVDHVTLIDRIVRSTREPLVPVLAITSAEERVAFSGGHVYRGTQVPALIGTYVYPAGNGTLIAVDRFGPSGPAQETRVLLGEDGPLGRGLDDALVVALTRGGLVRVVDAAPPAAAPASLLATKCWDPAAPNGLPVGAIAYDVTTPLWSDGAAKERFVVVPRGAKVTSRPDGDLLFPVGTIAVKTFSVDGKRVETRLLVQHDIEDWVGYSYAWNEAGTDAQLVNGNRIAPLAGGKSWYFPSRADCSACHTPAAGYTLGLEAKQLAGHGDTLAELDANIAPPIDSQALATLVPVDAPAPATTEARARSYLHANCSICHREGSATGVLVDLDLRLETTLAKSGLCKEPQAGALGITDARIVAPGDPARSVLLARMRALDERRMPKLASRVVDEAGAAAVEAWVRGLASCP